MLLRELKAQERIWDVLVEPARKVRIGNKIYFDNNKFYCEVVDNTTNRGRTVRFSYDGDLFKVIERIGEMPLPGYIKRDPTEHDKETYQCVFANPEKTASIAPPTAGLHFTQKMLKELDKKGVRIAYVSLNIGQGIFENIEVEDLTKHRMYSEYFEITKDNADTINKSLKSLKKSIDTTKGVVLWITESNTVSDWIENGRDYVRFSLAATAKDLYLHPYNQTIQEYPEMDLLRAELDKLIGISGNQKIQFIARIGHSSKPYFSYRKSLDKYII